MQNSNFVICLKTVVYYEKSNHKEYCMYVMLRTDKVNLYVLRNHNKTNVSLQINNLSIIDANSTNTVTYRSSNNRYKLTNRIIIHH